MPGVVGIEEEQPGEGEHRFTCYVNYKHGNYRDSEEVDVNARTKTQARALAEEYAIANLEKGWLNITVSQPRIGFYL